MENNAITIRAAKPNELNQVYGLITAHDQWTQFNGPYFPYAHPTRAQFKSGTFQRLVSGQDMQLVVVDDLPVGSVNCYWECEDTRWLETGIVIYNHEYWGQGIAAAALPIWISNLFNTRVIERIGMTTWSGNPRMMALALKLGFQQEARLRKVRYYQGEYYDSVKYGILRCEWQARN